MTAEEFAEYLRRYGYLPISGGQHNAEEGDENDENDDDGDDGETGADPGKTPKPKTYTDADLDAIVRQRLRRGKSKLRDELRAEILQQIQDEQAGKDGDLKDQLSAANRKLEHLDVMKQMVLRYEEAAEDRYEAGLALLPEALREMAPDDDADPLDKEEWLIKAQRTANKLQPTQPTNGADADEKPKPERKAQRGARFNDPKRDAALDESKLKKMTDRFKRSGYFKPM